MNDLRIPDGCGLRLRSHSVHMEDRALITISGVSDVGSFNDREVLLSTEGGAMSVEGVGLHISRLDLNDGQIVIEGEISAVIYEDEPPEKRGSLLSRLFR